MPGHLTDTTTLDRLTSLASRGPVNSQNSYAALPVRNDNGPAPFIRRVENEAGQPCTAVLPPEHEWRLVHRHAPARPLTVASIYHDDVDRPMKHLSAFLLISLCSVPALSTAADCEEYEKQIQRLDEFLRTHCDQVTFSRDVSEYTAIENTVNEHRNKVIAKLKREGRSVNPVLYRIVGKSKDSWASARWVLQLSEPLMQSRLRILEAELRLTASGSEDSSPLLAEASSLLDEGLQSLVRASFEAHRQARITFELLMYLSSCGDLS